jgi:cob(I)alamin adenosyltransferase
VKIYTKTGDGGETGLFGGARVQKDDARVEAYGAVDELNAVLGTIRASGHEGWAEDAWLHEMAEIERALAAAQARLFAVGAQLATPPAAAASVRASLPPVEAAWIDELESQMDAWEEKLAPLRQFVLPGGTPLAAALHHARAVCRRAERRVVALHRHEPVSPTVLAYLNRLADFLFVAARAANRSKGVAEPLWDSGRKA